MTLLSKYLWTWLYFQKYISWKSKLSHYAVITIIIKKNFMVSKYKLLSYLLFYIFGLKMPKKTPKKPIKHHSITDLKICECVKLKHKIYPQLMPVHNLLIYSGREWQMVDRK